MNQGLDCANAFLKVYSQRAKDNVMQTWQTELYDSTRASTYVLFSEFGFKKYLDMILISKYMYALTRLKTSNHRLAIESGRWTKSHSTPRSDRKSQLCNTLEDEFHFMLKCPLYRVIYIRKYWRKRTHMHKFIEFFKSENSIVVKNVATYVYKKVWKKGIMFYT